MLQSLGVSTTSSESSTAKGGGEVSADISEGFAQLASLQSRWEELFVSRPNEPSTSFEWVSAMARHHVGSTDRCFIIRLEQGRDIVGIVPLMARALKVMGQRITIVAPLTEVYNTHSDLLLRSTDDDVVAAFVRTLDRLPVDWDCFRMASLLEHNPLTVVFRRCLHGAGYRIGIRDGLPAYVLSLPGSYGEYLAARSSKFRNHLKRIERKILSSGAVEVSELRRPEEFAKAYDALLRVEQASWKQLHGTAISAVERQTRFYRDFCQAALGTGRLHLQWLTLDAKPVAYNLGYLTADGYHYLKTSYDHTYRPVSPATYLRARLIESLISGGVRRLDFPGEPYEWERQWTGDIRRRTVLTVYSRTLRGRVLEVVERLRHRRRVDHRVQHVDPRAMRP